MKEKILSFAFLVLLSVGAVSADVVTGPTMPATAESLAYLGAATVVIGLSAWFAIKKIRG